METSNAVVVPARRLVTVLALAVTLAAMALVSRLALQAGAATTPGFTNYAAPGGLGTDAGEPSIGVNWNTGKVMYQAGLETLRVDFSQSPPSWTSVGSTITSTTTLDPILFTDHTTGRTFVSQLSADCSLMAFSDNDGGSWTQNPVGCGLAAGADHQTVGGGVFASGLTGPTTSYPHTVYYCAQAIATAQCSLSQNGGLSFNPSVPIYNATACGGLHGHIKSGPKGEVYVPNADCGGKQAAVVSRDNGTTWSILKVPDSGTQDESDPSIGVGSAGTVYLGYQGGNGHAMVSVLPAGSTTWRPSVDVGTAFGIQNIQFPSVVAGDDNRAAFAFLGTPTAGDDQASSFPGVWHLYVSTTYDGGSTWQTVDATPSDPVQRGCIWLGGGSNQCRNLLDFMDVTIDRTGNILVGYADGCIGSCVNSGPNSYSSLATIARQTSGTGLLSSYDPTGPTAPSAPTLSGTAGNARVDLSWTAPSDGGSAITGYTVYRSDRTAPLATTAANVTSYADTAVTNGTAYTYTVTASNSVGEGARSNPVTLTPQAPSAPSAPQSLIATTAKGKATGVNLSWSAPASSGSSAVTGYKVYRATAGTTTFSPIATVGGTSYNDTATTSGATYSYQVTALNSVGESPPSNTATATAK